MVWIEPLNLQQWFVNVLSGSATYFAPIAIFAIICMAAYFRMSGLTMGFMLFVFMLMFFNFIPPSLVVFIAIIAGLLVGWVISKIVK